LPQPPPRNPSSSPASPERSASDPRSRHSPHHPLPRRLPFSTPVPPPPPPPDVAPEAAVAPRRARAPPFPSPLPLFPISDLPPPPACRSTGRPLSERWPNNCIHAGTPAAELLLGAGRARFAGTGLDDALRRAGVETGRLPPARPQPGGLGARPLGRPLAAEHNPQLPRRLLRCRHQRGQHPLRRVERATTPQPHWPSQTKSQCVDMGAHQCADESF
ncbi:unnamed protein product, partial [Urochloa humidicola]